MYSLNPLFKDRKKYAPFNQEQLNIIKDYLDQGFKKKEVQELTGIGSDALNRRIRENDWTAKRKRQAGLTQQELDEIHEKYLKGISLEELSKEYSISIDNLADRVANNKWTKAKRKTKYTCNENYFDDITTEHQAYWLGFLMADGFITSKRTRPNYGNESQCVGFSISIKDAEIFEKFKKDLNSNHPINIYTTTGSYNKDTKVGRILITSQHMVDALKKYGMVENKTLVLKFPDLPEELVPAFIRGYSDGDGSIIISQLATGQVKYAWNITSTKEMCEGILKYLGKANLKLFQRFPEREVNNWTIKIDGNIQVPKLLDIIYKDATIFLQRKYNKYAEMRGSNG